MPISISRTPWDGQASRIALSRIIAPSPPSLEKRFSPRKRLPRKFSKASASSTQRSALSLRSGEPSERMRVGFDALAHPVPHRCVVDVHELEADLARVGGLQHGEHVAQLHPLAVAEIGIPRLAVEIRLAEAELLEVEARIALRLVFERVDVRLGVAERAVVVNQATTRPKNTRSLSAQGEGRDGGTSRRRRQQRPSAALSTARCPARSLRKTPTTFLDRARVLAPLGVFRLQQIRVCRAETDEFMGSG
jgi:hypothetical protein